MKRNGNIAVNKIYNPRNRQPDMPLDADEVDSAMERFIRKKYQDKSLPDGNTRRQVRNEGSPPVPPKSPEAPSPPPVPSKKGRFFGFGLRASSSAYPLSKHDKKKLPPEPRVESAFTISSDDYRSVSRTSDARAPMSDTELQRKLVQLRDMGFPDIERNTNMLRRLNGNVERTVDALVQMGPSIGERSSSSNVAPQPTSSSTGADATGAFNTTKPAPRSSTNSNNPFDQLAGAQGQGFGLSVAPTQQSQITGQSNNPFDQPTRSQTDSGLVNSFQGLQVSQPVSQPLFPHSTGGYPVQQPPTFDPRLQTMTPPMPTIPQQYGYYAASPAPGITTNPFFQPVQPQMTGNNPFFAQQQSQQPWYPEQQPQQQQPQQQMPNTAAANPFMNFNNTAQQSNAVSPSVNPFGLPPSQQSPPHSAQEQFGQTLNQTGFNSASVPASATAAFPLNNPFQQQSQQHFQAQQSPQFPDFQYGQPQPQQQYQQQQQQQQATQQPSNPYQMSSNPCASFNQPQFTQQQSQQAQPTALTPQQTGRYDKSSILALYNYPQLAPPKAQGLTSIPEPDNGTSHAHSDMTNVAGRRSATMPISMRSMHSAGGGGNVGPNRNPFFQTSASPSQQQIAAAPAPGIMARHVSQESVNISNLEGGRHSPDAFANLSARYVR